MPMHLMELISPLWLHENFKREPPTNAIEDIMGKFARAYIIALLSIVLFADN